MRRTVAVVVVAALALAGGAAVSEERVSPEAFEAEVEGLTIRFEANGAPAGAERYLPGRDVIWQGPDGRCLHGSWHADGGDVCFAYEDAPGLRQCWEVRRDADGLLARPSGARPGPGDLRAVSADPEPLRCPGPDTGV